MLSANRPRSSWFSQPVFHKTRLVTTAPTHVLVNDGGSLPLNRGQDDVQEIVHIGNGRDRLEAVDGHGFEEFSEVARFNRRGSRVAFDERKQGKRTSKSTMSLGTTILKMSLPRPCEAATTNNFRRGKSGNHVIITHRKR